MHRLPTLLRRLVVVGGVVLVVGLGLPAVGQARALSCLVPAGGVVAGSSAPLRFGIYPGGAAGSVDLKSPPRPEDPAKRLAALQTLAGANPFVVRLYSAWTGDAAADDVSGWLDSEIAGYTAAGLQVELVVRYKPAGADARSAPATFAKYVRTIVRRYGPDPRVVSLQVTNEANLPGAPEAADGAFAGAVDAVIEGVIAAKDQAREDGHDHLRVGFNWAYDERPAASSKFWAALGQQGGQRFADAVDWVGLNTYPGTWAPQIPVSSLLPDRAATAVKDSVRSLRDCLMPLAGLDDRTALHIAENGFPTGSGRSDRLQAHVLDAMVTAVDALRTTYGITDYRWFDLRDSSSTDPSLESHYGITRDDYTPKPAYTTYRNLINHHNHTTTPRGVGDRSCRRSPVRVTVPRLRSRRATSLVVQIGDADGRVRRSPVPRTVRMSVRSGRTAVALRVTGRAQGRPLTRVERRTYRVC